MFRLRRCRCERRRYGRCSGNSARRSPYTDRKEGIGECQRVTCKAWTPAWQGVPTPPTCALAAARGSGRADDDPEAGGKGSQLSNGASSSQNRRFSGFGLPGDGSLYPARLIGPDLKLSQRLPAPYREMGAVDVIETTLGTRPRAKPRLVFRFVERCLRSIIPAANPDFEGSCVKVCKWWVEIDSAGTPQRSLRRRRPSSC